MAQTGFNADERAAEREGGIIVIGGKTYHARRLTNKRLRDIRRVSRAAQLDSRKAGRESEEYKEAYEDALKAGLRDDEGKVLKGAALEAEAERIALEAGATSEAVDVINARSLKQQLPLLLVKDDMNPPSEAEIEKHLNDDLDTRDVGDLMTYLVGTPDEDPTPAS